MVCQNEEKKTKTQTRTLGKIYVEKVFAPADLAGGEYPNKSLIVVVPSGNHYWHPENMRMRQSPIVL